MTQSATDRRLAVCDWASCKSVATAEHGGYDFCPSHLAEHLRIEAGDDPEGEPVPDDVLDPRAHGHGTEAGWAKHKRDGEIPCQRCKDAHATAQRERSGRAGPPPASPLGGSVGALLEQAAQHSNARVRRLGEKVTGAIEELRIVLADHTERERRKQQDAEERRAARAEVDRLQAELAAARVRARETSRPAASAAVRTQGSRSTNRKPVECRKGCGRTLLGAQGRAAHERHCAEPGGGGSVMTDRSYLTDAA